MRPTYSPLLPLLLTLALLAGCGSTTVPVRSTAGRGATARQMQPFAGRSRCGDPDDCAHIRLVAPLEWHLLRGVTLTLDSPQCAHAMVPPQLDAGEDYPLNAHPFAIPFNHRVIPLGIAFMADPCVQAPNARGRAIHRMTLVPGPVAPPPGALPTNYEVFALHLDSDGTLSAETVASPGYELNDTLYFQTGATLEVTPGQYAFYLATSNDKH